MASASLLLFGCVNRDAEVKSDAILQVGRHLKDISLSLILLGEADPTFRLPASRNLDLTRLLTGVKGPMSRDASKLLSRLRPSKSHSWSYEVAPGARGKLWSQINAESLVVVVAGAPIYVVDVGLLKNGDTIRIRL